MLQLSKFLARATGSAFARDDGESCMSISSAESTVVIPKGPNKLLESR